MRRPTHAVSFAAIGVAVAAVVVACSAFDAETTTDNTGADSSSADAPAPLDGSAADAGACVSIHPDASPLDLEGCACTSGTTRACAFGLTGGASGCKVGQQTCVGGRWTSCSGATAPAAAETCDDTTDDDCDGTLNNGCRCADVYNLCMTSSGAARPDVFLDIVPSTAKMGDTIELFIAYHGTINGSPSISNTTTNLCPGQGGAPCLTGAQCAGWSAKRRTMVVAAPTFQLGANTLKVFINEATPPCDNGAGTAKTTAVLTVTQ